MLDLYLFAGGLLAGAVLRGVDLAAAVSLLSRLARGLAVQRADAVQMVGQALLPGPLLGVPAGRLLLAAEPPERAGHPGHDPVAEPLQHGPVAQDGLRVEELVRVG